MVSQEMLLQRQVSLFAEEISDRFPCEASEALGDDGLASSAFLLALICLAGGMP